MTHSPPVPEGNQSPYPLHETPHRHGDGLPPVRRDEDGAGLSAGTIIGAAVVAGIGAAAAAGAYFLSLRKQPKPKRRRKAKAAPRKTAAKR